VIEITAGFTSIEIAPDDVPGLNVNGFWGTAPQERPPQNRDSTGARVTVEFARAAPVTPNSDVRVYYDIAENGEVREIRGVPQLTHTTSRPDDCQLYHYRLSHWIPGPSVMQFLPL
jgi:hypothetical protein